MNYYIPKRDRDVMTEPSSKRYLSSKYYEKSHRYWMWGHVALHKNKNIVIMLLIIIATILQTFIPLLFGRAIDDAIPDKNLDLLVFFSLLIIGLGVVKGIISYISGIMNDQVAQDVEAQVRVEFFDNLASKNMDFFNKAKVGDLMSQATQDTQNMTFAVSPGVRAVVGIIIGLVATFVAMFSLNPTLSIFFLIILPVYIFFMFRYAKILQPISLERQERLAKINTTLQETITGIRVVRTFSAQEREKQSFTKEIRLYESILIKRGTLSALFIPTLLLGLVTSAMYLFGVYIIEASQSGQSSLLIFSFFIPVQALTVGDLIAFIALTGILLWPTTMLRFLIDATVLGFAGAGRIFATLMTQAELEPGKEVKLSDFRGDISYKDVSFYYEEGGQEALSHFSLDIKSGETVAIIGPTGSGKSTVGRLLNRLYDVTGGSIEIDGHNVKDIEINQLRQLVGVIEQDTFLFSTSIKSNIAYGMHELSDEGVVNAAKMAQAHDFITEFKDGYDTILGERGVTLSGGQKQRVAIARTFVTDPKILIFDDSTSAVDSNTEAKIQSAMDELLKDRTTIIITHRLSTLRRADKIVFLRLGKIERIGTHDELIKTFEPYRQIYSGFIKLPPIQVEGHD